MTEKEREKVKQLFPKGYFANTRKIFGMDYYYTTMKVRWQDMPSLLNDNVMYYVVCCWIERSIAEWYAEKYGGSVIRTQEVQHRCLLGKNRL